MLDDIPAPKSRPTRRKAKLELSDFMPVERDFAFVVAEKSRGRHRQGGAAADRALVAEIGIFDIYQGKGVVEGTKSVAISVTCSRANTR